MVCGDGVVAEPFREQVRDALRHAPRVDEHERRAMRADVCRDGVEHLTQLLARRHRLELTGRQFDADVEGATMADVDDRAARASVGATAPLPRADQQPGDRLDRTLRRRQSDADRAPRTEPLEALERDRKM